MTMYWVLLAILVGAGVPLCQKQKRWGVITYLVLAAAALTAVSALRFGIGFDYYTYAGFYQEIGQNGLFPFMKAYPNIEPGFALLLWLLTFLSKSPYFLFFALGALCSGLVALAVYLQVPRRYAWVAMYAYVTLTFFYGSLNLMRQNLAAVVALFSLPFLKKKRLIPFLLIVLAASLLHKSALILLPVYFLARLPLGRWTAGAYGGAALLFYLFSEPILAAVTKVLYSGYGLDSRYMQPGGTAYVVVPLLLFALTLFCRRALLAADARNEVYVNYSLYALVFYFLMTKHFLLERLGIYFFIAAIIALPSMIAAMERAAQSAGERLREERRKKLPGKKGKSTAEQSTVGALAGAKRDAKSFYWFALGSVLVIGFVYQLFAANMNFHNVFPFRGVWDAPASAGQQESNDAPG